LAGVRPDATVDVRLRQEPSDGDAEKSADRAPDAREQASLLLAEAVHPQVAPGVLAAPELDIQDADRSGARSCAAVEAEQQLVVRGEAPSTSAKQQERRL